MTDNPSQIQSDQLSWREVSIPRRPDIIGERTRADGKTEYLLHNKALDFQYYIAVKESQ